MSTTAHRETPRSDTAKILGALLILVGGIALATQALRPELDRGAWPLVIIIPGAIALAIGSSIGGARPLLYIGSIAATVGAVLWYQTLTAHWVSWTYAWALIVVAIGVAQVAEGALDARRRLVREGSSTIVGGIGAFIVAMAFFEGVLGLGRDRVAIGGDVLGPAMVAIGILMLVMRLVWHEED